MRCFVRSCALVLVVALGAGCSPTIGAVNVRPEKYYQQKVSLVGRVTRMQTVAGETVLELADPREHRLLVRMQGTPDAQIGDWVKVTGVLVPEARVGTQTLYDVLVAEEIEGASEPWLDTLT